VNRISPTTKQRIKAYLETFIEKKIEAIRSRQLPLFSHSKDYLEKRSKKGRLKPFHAAIIPEEIRKINAFERSFSTTLGTTFEECARLIALDHHKKAERSYDLTSNISTSAINEIEHQVSLFDRNSDASRIKPSIDDMIESVLNSRKTNDLELRTVRADLFVLANDGTEYYFEIKSPKPNKGQCLEVTQRILRFHLVTGKKRPEAVSYFAMAYNPYGPTRDHYRWSMAKNYMPFDDGLVIGHEFWEIIGGPGAYKELLDIYRTVGKEKSKYMIDALAFGF
jgi:hypothetical protein